MPKNTKPEIMRIEVVVSPENYPRTRAALEDLKRVMVEEAQDYAKSQGLPDTAVPPMILALLELSQRFAKANVEKMCELFPDLQEVRRRAGGAHAEAREDDGQRESAGVRSRNPRPSGRAWPESLDVARRKRWPTGDSVGVTQLAPDLDGEKIGGQMTRAEHLQWAKDRALEYLDLGDLQNAFSSFLSDMGKHDELAEHLGLDPRFIAAETSFPQLKTAGLRRWIEGCN